MDGGSNGTLMDGGNTWADGGHDHGSMHDGGGHDGAQFMHSPQADQPFADGGALGSLLNHSAQNQHGFLAHLLGLDHDGGGHAHSGHSVHGNATGHVSQTAIWSSALQSLKMSDFTHGLNFTPAMGMFFLFAGFVSWLFILYGIRHNEPLANSILGTAPVSQGPAAYCQAADRRIVNATRAMPIPLQGQGAPGELPGQNGAPQSAPVVEPVSADPAQPFGTPVTNNVNEQNLDTASSQLGGAGMSVAAPIANTAVDSYTLPAGQPLPTAFGGRPITEGSAACAVATVRHHGAPKLKFIVNN